MRGEGQVTGTGGKSRNIWWLDGEWQLLGISREALGPGEVGVTV